MYMFRNNTYLWPWHLNNAGLVFRGPICTQSNFLHHYTPNNNRISWHKVGWVHRSLLLTINYDLTLYTACQSRKSPQQPQIPEAFCSFWTTIAFTVLGLQIAKKQTKKQQLQFKPEWFSRLHNCTSLNHNYLFVTTYFNIFQH